MKTEQSPMLLVAVVLFGVLVAGLLTTRAVQYWAVTTMTSEIRVQQAALASAKRQANEQRKLAPEREELQKQFTSQPMSWSWSEQLSPMVTQVTAIMKPSKTKIDTLLPQPIVTKKQLARFPLRLTLHADLAQLTSVLLQLRAAEPVMAVDHINIRSGKTAKDPLQVELTVSSFVLLDGRKATGGAR